MGFWKTALAVATGVFIERFCHNLMVFLFHKDRNGKTEFQKYMAELDNKNTANEPPKKEENRTIGFSNYV